jgi:hypothetical protein
VIRFSCPACQKVLKAPDQGAGRKTHCPRCGQRLLIPPPVRVENKTILGRPEPSTATHSPSLAADPKFIQEIKKALQ